MADFASIVSDLATTVAATVAVIVAVKGLNTWRAELRGRTEYDLARRILLALYRVREAIKTTRSPSMSEREFENRPDRKPDDRPWSGKDMRYLYQQRWNGISAALVEVDANLLEAEALWGDVLKKPRADLQKCIADLLVSILKWLRANAPDDPGIFERKPLTAEEMEAIDAVVWDLGEDKDAFADRIKAAIRDVEDVVRPHLRR